MANNVKQMLLGTSAPCDDSKLLNQIHSTHSLDARQIDVNPVLDVLEEILRQVHLTAHSGPQNHEPTAMEALLEKMGGAAGGTMLEELAIAVQKVCCAFTCKCTAGDAHASTLSVLKVVGNYSWDAKVVIATAAFAVTYGELWLVSTLDQTNPLAYLTAILKKTPTSSEINEVLRPKFGAIDELAKIVVDVAKTLIQFRMLPSKYISLEDALLATSFNHIVTATYWTIRCIVACGAQIVNIGLTSRPTLAIEAWDLSSLARKEKSVHDQLVKKLSLCYIFIEEKKKEETYNNLLWLFSQIPNDNVKTLKSLIYGKTDIFPLVEGLTKKQVQIDVIQGKTVLLFISDLDVSKDELEIMDNIYKESKSKGELQYEIIWLPIVDWTIVTRTYEHEKKIKELQNKMSWYTLFHPSLLDEVSIRFIKEQWGFTKKQIIVALDPMGKVVSYNAFHMLLIWGNAAYPFTSEEELWKTQTWKLEFILDGIYLDYVSEWIAQEDVHIVFFGGEDIEWIRKFTTTMKEGFKTAGQKLELVYVGKQNAKKAVEEIISAIESENLAHALPSLTSVRYFWSRLESMLLSKMILGNNVNNDYIMKEVMSMMSFGSEDQGWGFISKGGSNLIVIGKGDIIMKSLSEYQEWVETAKQIGFLAALREHMRYQSQTCAHDCNRLILSAIKGGDAPMALACAHCCHPMHNCILYRRL